MRNTRADTYDEWYKTFEGAVETYVDWELLKKHLPENKAGKILDATGGTGRITLPLAKMGYSLTLCDKSPHMLDVAKQKLLKEGVFNKVTILECDIRNLHFADEIFDFVLCWDEPLEGIQELAVNEVIRVTKKGGTISIFLVNKWASAINNFYKNPAFNLASIEALPSYLKDKHGKYRFVSTEEDRKLFEIEGISVLEILLFVAG